MWNYKWFKFPAKKLPSSMDFCATLVIVHGGSGGGGGVGTSEVWVAEHRRYHHFSEMEVNTNSYDKLKVLTHTTGLYNKEICKLKEECKNI